MRAHGRASPGRAAARNKLALVEAGALGVLTTHDLALADIAAALGPRDGQRPLRGPQGGGRMTFDYRLHPGVVTKSNALELMRSVGLDV